jgi:hypothetical protein
MEQPTCGAGLAAHSALEAGLADLTAAVADVLDAHIPALDLTDGAARAEHDVYQDLVRGHRAAAAQLRALADRMASQRGLPMGRHDESVMSEPAARDSFAAYVSAKRDLLAHLQAGLEQDEEMLAQMRRMA